MLASIHKQFRNPTSELAELWALVGEEFRDRCNAHFVVLFVNSHQTTERSVEVSVPSWLVAGNAMADVAAGEAAKKCRVSEGVRSRMGVSRIRRSGYECGSCEPRSTLWSQRR